MTELDEKIEIIKELIEDCDSILIGAGAGLSIGDGLDNEGLKFNECMKDFIDAYGIKDFYSGGFYPFPTPEEKWAYFSRLFMTYLNSKSTELYENIYRLVESKDYFVITTNVDGHFEKSGFDPNRIFETQGDIIHIQCSVPCHDTLYESTGLIREMVARTKDRKIPTELLPKCPLCGEIMRTHLREDDSFVQNDYWYQQNDAYMDFIKRNKNKRVLLLEFGVGFNTPTIIRFPFENMTMNHRKWNLIRFNADYPGFIMELMYSHRMINEWKIIKSLKLDNELQDRFIPISEDINEVIKQILF